MLCNRGAGCRRERDDSIGPTRFSASVIRNAYRADPACEWRTSINGGGDNHFATREEAMAYIEREISRVGEEFVRDYAEFRVRRGRNRWSTAVDASRHLRQPISNPV